MWFPCWKGIRRGLSFEHQVCEKIKRPEDLFRLREMDCFAEVPFGMLGIKLSPRKVEEKTKMGRI